MVAVQVFVLGSGRQGRGYVSCRSWWQKRHYNSCTKHRAANWTDYWWVKIVHRCVYMCTLCCGSLLSSVSVLLTRTWASRPRTWRQNTCEDHFRLRGAREHKTKKKLDGGTISCNKHFIKQCQRLKAIKAIKLIVAWSLNCLHVIVCLVLRCPGELTKDLTLKAKDLTLKAKDNNTVLFILYLWHRHHSHWLITSDRM